MEALKRLEAVQRVLQLLAEHGVGASGGDGDRQLAEILAVLAAGSASLAELEARRLALGETLLTLPAGVVEGAAGLCGLGRAGSREGTGGARKDGGVTRVVLAQQQRRHTIAPSAARQQPPAVSLPSMERAQSTLEDFISSYFMFHGLDCRRPEDVCRHLPTLCFVESFIYQLDEANEAAVGPTADGLTGDDHSASTCGAAEESMEQLKELLRSRGVLFDRLSAELADGVGYWVVERELCEAVRSGRPARLLTQLSSAQALLPIEHNADAEAYPLVFTQVERKKVLLALRWKSFDYRVLNLLLYRLTSRPVNEAHMSFLAASETLVEICDDLLDYEDDVLRGSFNVLRMFVAIYGPQEGPVELAKLIGDVEETYETLLAGLEPSLAESYRHRCEEAVLQGRAGGGGGSSRHALGTWSIPGIISDEQAFRERCGAAGAEHG
eukprot:SM000097S24793  [mRNA]  locus=s97:267329:270730:- [translate_table: standard]